MAFSFPNDALLDVLGRDAVYTPAGGSAATIRICLTLGVEEMQLGGQISPQAIDGQAGCRAADVPGVKAKDTLEVDGVTYRVLKAQTDETGWMTLFLGKGY